MTTNAWVEALGAERAALGRASTSGRVADVLRTHVTEGRLPPGTRLSEEEIGAALGVSRNTLREAFRLLTHERLLVHEFNRGVFVRKLATADVQDLFAFRRIVEPGAIRAARTTHGEVPEHLLAGVRRAVEQGEEAARSSRWGDVGTANMQFHQAIGALAESPRIDEAMRHVLAELRLVFHAMAAPQTFHEPYLAENRAMVDLLADGRCEEAETALTAYLGTAEEQLVAAHRAG